MRKNHENRKPTKGIIRWLALLTALVVLVTSVDMAQFSVLAENVSDSMPESTSDDIGGSIDETVGDESGDGIDYESGDDSGDDSGAMDDNTEDGSSDDFEELAEGRDIEYVYGDEIFIGDEEEEFPEEEEGLLEDGLLPKLKIADGEDLELLGATGDPVTFDNNGYPYGIKMDGSSITMKVKIATGTATTYQWQKATAKDGTYTNISGATTAEYKLTPTSRNWYRCLVNGVSETKSVMAIKNGASGEYKFCKANEYWYLSNGSMAYSIIDSNHFDIVGLYNKNGTNYWINTSYGRSWQLECSNSAGPSAKTVGDDTKYGTGAAEIAMSFDDKAQSDHVVKVDVTLPSGYVSMGMGCDTMLGTSPSVTSYADKCSLKALMNGDRLKQIQMVDAKSLADVTDPDTVSYVFIPTTQCSNYWIGYWNERQFYAYRTQNGETASDNGGTYVSSWSTGGKHITTEVQNMDSGMCVSWLGMESGSHIKFQFNIGTLAQTGAETKSVATAYTITVEEADQNHYYALFRKDTGEMVRPWVTDTDNDGKVVFEDLDQDTEYIVKNVTKSGYNGNPDDPDQNNPASEETKTNIDPLNPPSTGGEGEEPKAPPVVTTTSTSIDITGLDMLYTYWLENADGEPIGGGNGTPRKPSGDNIAVSFNNLEPGTTYYLAAVQDNNTRYEPRPIQTLCAAIFVDNEHSTETPRELNLEKGAHITKPTDPSFEGYVFSGWYTTPDFAEGSMWNFDTDTLGTQDSDYKNVTLYAKWLLHSHTWTYEMDPANDKLWVYCTTNTASDKPCEYYGATLSDCANPLYVSITAPDMETSSSPYSGATINDTLTAVDAVNNSIGTPQYYLSDGTTLTNSDNSGATSNGGAPVKPGDYVVKVVVTGQGGTEYTISSEFTVLRKSYGVTFVDEEFPVSTPAAIPAGTLRVGDLIPNPGDRPVYEGYKFVGWYSSSDFAEGTLWNFAEDVLPDNNLTLYAKWITHEHHWSYRKPTDKDNVLEIYCDNDDVHVTPPCDYFDNGNPNDRGTESPLTISIITEDILHDDAPYDGITIDNEFEEVAPGKANVGPVVYYRVDEENDNAESKTTADNSGATSEGGLPKNKGYYVAKVIITDEEGTEHEIKSYFRIKSVPRTITFTDKKFNTETAPVTDIIENTLIPKPNDPRHDYYAFTGWYKTEACLDADKWNFAEDVMPDEDLTLYAGWIPHEHHWVITQPSDDEIKLICDNEDVLPIPPCEYFDDGDGHTGSDAPLTIKLITEDVLHDDGPYDGITVVDEITPVDPSKVIVGPVVYYRVDEEDGNAESKTTPDNSGSESEGGVPKNKGYYVAKVIITDEEGNEHEIKSYFRINPVPHKVTFVDNVYHTETAPILDIVEKTLITQPTSPQVDFVSFGGWYTSENYLDSEYWDFATDLMPDNDLVLYAKWVEHAHGWDYVQQSASTLEIYCNNKDVEPYPDCIWYGEDIEHAGETLKVSISTPNMVYTGSKYDLANLVDTLSGIDDANNSVGPIVYYLNSDNPVKTTSDNSGADTEGGAPVNAGWYFAQVTVSGQNGVTFELKSAFRINRATLHDLNLVIDPEVYTVTGDDIEAQYKVLFNSKELVEGVDYELDEDSCVVTSEIGQYAITVNGINNCTGSVTKLWKIVDASKPVGKITIEGMLPTEFDEFIAPGSTDFDRFFNTKQKVTITASDADTVNIKNLKVSYFLAANAYSLDQLKTFPDNRWMPIESGKSITLSDNRKYVVYVKVEDPSGNISYVSSQGFEIDLVKPVIVGIASGKEYCNPAIFRVTEEGSGIASVIIDGVEAFDPANPDKVDFEIPGTPGSKGPHEVIVRDKAGNETKVSNVYIDAEHEHEWVPADGGTEPTCLDDGEKLEKCKKCGAQRHTKLDHGDHLWDYEDDSLWKIVWTWDEENKTYTGKAYLYCKNDCGTYKEFDCEIETEIVEPTEPGEKEKVIYKAIVKYPNPDYPLDPSDPDYPGEEYKEKEFDKTMPLSDTEHHGDSELATGVIVAPGAPVTTATGLNTDTAEGVLTDAEKELLENGERGETESETDENVKIIVFLEVSDIQASVSSTDKTLAISDFKDEIGSKANLNQIKYIDLSMYKRVITEKVKYSVPVDKDEQTERLVEYSSDMTANVDVSGLSFPEVKNGYERTYYVSRVHDYSDEQDGSKKNAQIVYKGKAVNGKLPITTNLFCTYAITYGDERKGGGGGGGGKGPGGNTPGGGSGGNDEPGGNAPGTTFDSSYISTMAFNANGNMRGTYGFISPKTGDNRHPLLWGILFVIFAALFVGMTKFLKDVGLFKIIKKII